MIVFFCQIVEYASLAVKKHTLMLLSISFILVQIKTIYIWHLNIKKCNIVAICLQF